MNRHAEPIGHPFSPLPLSLLVLPLALLVCLLWPVTGADALALLPVGPVGILVALAVRSGPARLSAIPVHARAAANGGRHGVATAATGGGVRR